MDYNDIRHWKGQSVGAKYSVLPSRYHWARIESTEFRPLDKKGVLKRIGRQKRRDIKLRYEVKTRGQWKSGKRKSIREIKKIREGGGKTKRQKKRSDEKG